MAPPVKTRNPFVAQGRRLIAIAELPANGVAEVETTEHGTLAVGRADGQAFAVSNVCRHQFAKMGRGKVTGDGCLECPWHRARYDVQTGKMLSGPKGRIFGLGPYSKAVQSVANAAVPLKVFPVTERDGAIWLA